MHLHHWHVISGTHKPIPKPSRCVIDAPGYIRQTNDEFMTKYLLCRTIQYCCICQKERTKKVRVYYWEDAYKNFIKEG